MIFFSHWQLYKKNKVKETVAENKLSLKYEDTCNTKRQKKLTITIEH